MGRSTRENPMCNENMNQTLHSSLNGKTLGVNIKEKQFPKGNYSIAKLTLKGTKGRNACYSHETKKLQGTRKNMKPCFLLEQIWKQSYSKTE